MGMEWKEWNEMEMEAEMEMKWNGNERIKNEWNKEMNGGMAEWNNEGSNREWTNNRTGGSNGMNDLNGILWPRCAGTCGSADATRRAAPNCLACMVRDRGAAGSHANTWESS